MAFSSKSSAFSLIENASNGPIKEKIKSRAGCFKCRVRKKKCDEIQPICSACQRLNLKCLWPIGPPDQVKREVKMAQVQPSLFKIAEDILVALSKSRTKADQASKKSNNEVLQKDMALPVYRVPDLHGFRHDISIALTIEHLFTGANFPVERGGQGASLTVRTELYYATQNDSLSYRAIRALGTFFSGVIHNKAEQVAEGLSEHGKVLSDLRDALVLAQPSHGDVIAAITLTNFFTLLAPDNQGNWIKHAFGLQCVVIALGPKAFQTLGMRRLFENNRMIMIMACCKMRQKTALGDSSWTATPWVDADKDFFQKLMDLFARFPGVYATYDKVVLLNPESQKSRSALDRLTKRLLSILQGMDEWRRSIDDVVNAQIKASPQHKEAMEAFGTQKPAVSFKDPLIAFSVALFDMMIILICRYFCLIEFSQDVLGCESPVCLDNSGPPTALLLDGRVLPMKNPLKRALLAGEEIATLIPWTTQDSLKGAGALYMSGPISIAYEIYSHHDIAKATWMGKEFVKVRNHWNSVGSVGVSIILKAIQGGNDGNNAKAW